MKTHHLASVTVAMHPTAVVSTKTYSARERNAFIKAMSTSHEKRQVSKDQTPSLKTFGEDMTGDSKRAKNLRKKVMSKAKPIVSSDNRRLQNNNQGNNNDQGNAYRNNNSNKNNLRDGTDDYYVAYGDWANSFGFDPTQYSLSYHRCAEVRQFDDQLAALEDSTSVFVTKHFAVFRFCPSKTCEGIRDYPEEEWMNEGRQGQQGAQQQQGQQGSGSGYDFNFGQQDENMFDRLSVGGANGEGCQSNYGEYMLEIGDYLELMADYHNERFETYCETCEECMYDVYQQWLQSGQDWQNRKLKDQADASWMDDLESESFQKHRELGYDPYKICPEYDTCRTYKQSCNAGVDETLTQYFECTQVQRNNGKTVYIGPRCSADGITITLGVFADKNCFEYIGNGLNIANFLGFALEEDALANYVTGSLSDVIPEEGIQAQKERYSQNYDAELAEYYSPVDNMCIPCMASRQPYEVRGNVYDYKDQDEYDDDINELCENLYLVSARCDKNFRSYSSKSKQAKYAEALVQEELTCDFIESVVMGNYDEMGFVNVENMQRYSPEAKSGMLADSMLWELYGTKIQEVSPLQVFGLIVAIAACVILSLWSYSLIYYARNQKPWRPRRGLKPPSFMTRENSGIVMGRSHSEASPSDLSDQNSSYYLT